RAAGDRAPNATDDVLEARRAEEIEDGIPHAAGSAIAAAPAVPFVRGHLPTRRRSRSSAGFSAAAVAAAPADDAREVSMFDGLHGHLRSSGRANAPVSARTHLRGRADGG